MKYDELVSKLDPNSAGAKLLADPKFKQIWDAPSMGNPTGQPQKPPPSMGNPQGKMQTPPPSMASMAQSPMQMTQPMSPQQPQKSLQNNQLQRQPVAPVNATPTAVASAGQGMMQPQKTIPAQFQSQPTGLLAQGVIS